MGPIGTSAAPPATGASTRFLREHGAEESDRFCHDLVEGSREMPLDDHPFSDPVSQLDLVTFAAICNECFR